MVITREMIQARLDSLNLGREEIVAQLHATSGAIQEAEHWLSQLDVVEPAEFKPEVEVVKNG